jgi:hypothetical protein
VGTDRYPPTGDVLIGTHRKADEDTPSGILECNCLGDASLSCPRSFHPYCPRGQAVPVTRSPGPLSLGRSDLNQGEKIEAAD